MDRFQGTTIEYWEAMPPNRVVWIIEYLVGQETGRAQQRKAAAKRKH